MTTEIQFGRISFPGLPITYDTRNMYPINEYCQNSEMYGFKFQRLQGSFQKIEEEAPRLARGVFSQIITSPYHQIKRESFQLVQLDDTDRNKLCEVIDKFDNQSAISSEFFLQKNHSICTTLMFTWIQGIRALITYPELLDWVVSAPNTQWKKVASNNSTYQQVQKHWILPSKERGNGTRFKRSEDSQNPLNTESGNQTTLDPIEKTPKRQEPIIPKWIVYTIECVSSFVGTLIFFKVATKIGKRMQLDEDKELSLASSTITSEHTLSALSYA